MKNFKKAALFTFLGFSTISLSSPLGGSVKEDRHFHFTGAVRDSISNTLTNIDVDKNLEFSLANSSLKKVKNADGKLAIDNEGNTILVLDKDGNPILEKSKEATVTQIRTASGQYEKIIEEAKEEATKAALEASKDPTDSDYKEAYQNTYNRVVLQKTMEQNAYDVDCRRVSMKMVEDMLFQKVQRRVINTEKNGKKSREAIRYYAERKDPTERALILKNLKKIRISRGDNASFACTPTTDKDGNVALCGELDITYSPQVFSSGPYKGYALGVSDPAKWREPFDKEAAGRNNYRPSNFMTQDDFYFLNQVTICGLAPIQMALIENNDLGNHIGDLGLSENLERWKNEDIAALSHKAAENDKDSFSSFLAQPENADATQSQFDEYDKPSANNAR